MKKLFITIILTFICVSGNAQNWNWAKKIGGNFSTIGVDSRGISTITDQTGNVYCTGSFRGQNISFDTVSIIGSGGSDMFLTKYDTNGDVLWSIDGGTGGDESPCGIVMDSQGFVYVTGSSVYPPNWPGWVWLAKYDSQGNEIWVKWLGGGMNHQCYASNTSIDKFDNIYITGTFDWSGSSIYTPAIFGNFNLYDYGSSARSIFILKCDTTGNISEAINTSNLDPSFGLWISKSTGITTDFNGNIYMTGSFTSDSISVGNNITLKKELSNNQTLFIAKYNSSLVPLWAKTLTGGDGIFGGLSADRNNNIIFCGSYSNSITFDSLTLNGTGVFVYKILPNGHVLFGKKIINGINQGSYDPIWGTDYQNSKKVSVDTSENIYITGYFNSSILMADAITINKIGSMDVFVVKYNSNGNALWVHQGNSLFNCFANGVECDLSGNVYITGAFAKDITFNSLSFNGGGSLDHFLIKYDTNGNVIFGKSSGGGKYKSERSFAICNDIQGNIYTSGYYGSDTIFLGATSLPNGPSAFISKYDQNGNCIWNKSRNWYFDDDISMVADNNGSVYTTGAHFLLRKYDSSGNFLWQKQPIGNFNDASNGAPTPDLLIDSLGYIYALGGLGEFNPDTLIIDSYILVKPPSYNSASFIVKFDNSGNVIWAKVIVLTQSWGTRGFAINNQGELLVTGDFFSNALFGSTTLATTNSAIFYARYDSNGNLIIAHKYNNDNPSNENICSKGSSKYITGRFQNSITLGSYSLTSNSGSLDIYIAKLDASDNIVWAKKFGGSGIDLPSSIKVDRHNNIYLLGNYYSPSISFGTFNLTHIGNGASGFLTVIDSLGNVLSAKKMGDSTITTVDMTIDSLGIVSVCGDFGNKSIAFNSNYLYNTDTSGTSSDIFIAKTCPLFFAHAYVIGSTIICQGDTAILFADSCSNCSYHWSSNDTTRSIIVTTSGNYNVTINNGCSNNTSPSINIAINNIPTASITPSETVYVCQGTSILLSASSCAGCTYLWNTSSTQNQIFASTPNNYSVITTNSCGTDTSSITTVVVNSLPSIPIITQNDSLLTSNSTTNNQWCLNGNIIAGATSQNYIVTQNGNYTLVVTDFNGCSATSAGINITTGMEEKFKNNTFLIIPNPSSGKFWLEVSSSNSVKIKIFNIFGEPIYESKNQNSEIDLSAQPKGIYFIQVHSGEKMFNKKLIIE